MSDARNAGHRVVQEFSCQLCQARMTFEYAGNCATLLARHHWRQTDIGWVCGGHGVDELSAHIQQRHRDVQRSILACLAEGVADQQTVMGLAARIGSPVIRELEVLRWIEKTTLDNAPAYRLTGQGAAAYEAQKLVN